MQELNLEQLKEAGANGIKKMLSSSGSPSCVVYADGHTYTPSSIGCYGSLAGGAQPPKHGGRRLMTIGIQHPSSWDKNNTEHQLLYLDYLFNRSPMAEAYISKGGTEVLKSRVAYLSVEVPGNLMMMGQFAVRHIWERPNHVTLFKALLDEGVPENIAFFYTQCILTTNTSLGEPSYSVAVNSSGHHTLGVSTYDMETVGNFVHNRQQRPVKPYRASTIYTGVTRMFRSKAADAGGANSLAAINSTPEGLVTFLNKNYVPGGTVEDTSNNPFASAKPAPRKGDRTYSTLSDTVQGFVSLTPALNKLIGDGS